MFRRLRVPLFGLALLTWVASNAGAGQDRAPADARPRPRPFKRRLRRPRGPFQPARPDRWGAASNGRRPRSRTTAESARSRTGFGFTQGIDGPRRRSADRRRPLQARSRGRRRALGQTRSLPRPGGQVGPFLICRPLAGSTLGCGWRRNGLPGRAADQLLRHRHERHRRRPNRTDRLRTTEASGIVERRAGGFTAGARAGWIGARGVEPGTSRLAPPIGDRFDDARTPGLADPVRYAHTGAYIELDRLDSRRYPTSGGLYRLELTRFRRLGGAEGRIGQLEADATQFLALPRRNAGFVLRARATLFSPTPGTDVPFYLMPTLGGDSSLRGYADYRFRDRHAAFVSVEYRYPVVRMVDAALFADAGTVAPTLAAFGRTPIARSYGVGLRFHSETKSIFRVDLAHGAEGFRVHVGTTTTIGELRRHLVHSALASRPRICRRALLERRAGAAIGRRLAAGVTPHVPTSTRSLQRRWSMKAWRVVPLAALTVAAATVVPRGAEPRFTPSDPVVSEADLDDASGARPTDANADRMRFAAALGQLVDRVVREHERQLDWRCPRWQLVRQPHRHDVVVCGGPGRGPNRLQEPLNGPWTVGRQYHWCDAGIAAEGLRRPRFYVKFDPPRFPELASAAEVIATKLLWAAGYWVPENYVVRLWRADLTLAADATFKGPDGVPRPITSKIWTGCSRVRRARPRVVPRAREPARSRAPARSLLRTRGCARTTRMDVVMHECRRELRGLRVFAAWSNHVDTKPGNSLDAPCRPGRSRSSVTS